MAEPYILAGDDVERLYHTFGQQITRLGDPQFAAALAQEPPDVIAPCALSPAVADLILVRP